jgi:membrane-bound lytic murein transglycosylase C
MLNPNRTVLILLAFSLWIRPIEAHHTATHQENDNKLPTTQANKTYHEILQRNKAILQAYREFEEKSAQVWGTDTVVPTAKIAVTYRNNMQQRSVVDYENGKVKVELALSSGEHPAAIEHRLANAVEDTLLQGTDERSILDIAKNPDAPKSNKPPELEGMVAKDDGTPLTRTEIDQFKKQKARAMLKRPIVGKDGKKRVIISTEFELVPDHIRKRAARFSDTINENALVHHIPTHLIYAIMETESYFNPTAKSPVPAFGLMQLVPGTGARDAYKFLFSKDIVVKDTYLYNAENNIELGVAYLHILYYRYLKRIKDPAARQWATIAAYNTGVQNVVKSFSGEYTKSKYASRWSWKRHAINKINKMKPEQVYEHLRNYLPYEETRDYIKKVRENIPKYIT